MRIVTASGHVILADDADEALLSQFSWFANPAEGGRFYAQARVRGSKRRVAMHRLLMDPPAGMVVHHRNNNGLDNRRANLEVTTQRQNTRYAHQGRPCVHPHKQTGKWRAQVRDETGKQVSLGMHATRAEALAAVQTYRSGCSR